MYFGNNIGKKEFFGNIEMLLQNFQVFSISSEYFLPRSRKVLLKKEIYLLLRLFTALEKFQISNQNLSNI